MNKWEVLVVSLMFSCLFAQMGLQYRETVRLRNRVADLESNAAEWNHAHSAVEEALGNEVDVLNQKTGILLLIDKQLIIQNNLKLEPPSDTPPDQAPTP